jgi:hypothetical protein
MGRCMRLYNRDERGGYLKVSCFPNLQTPSNIYEAYRLEAVKIS